MRAYSMDLRERVLHDSDAGMQAAAVASKYRVSASWVRRLKQRRRETGEVAPRQQRYGRHPVLASQLHTLAALIREQPDRTLADLQVALGTSASLATIWRAAPSPTYRSPWVRPPVWDDLAGRETAGLYRKKKRYARPNTIAPTSRPPARSGRRLPRRSTRLASSFWMKAGSPPISCGAMGAAFAASGSPITRPRVGGRAVPSSPRCG